MYCFFIHTFCQNQSQIMFSNKLGQKFVPTRSNKKRVRIVQTETDQHLVIKKSQFSNRASLQQEDRPKCIDPFSKTNFKEPQFQRKILKTTNQKPHPKILRTQPDELFQKPVAQTVSISSNKYEIDGVVGKGTFGTVYIGHVRGTGEKIAVKKVLQDKRYKNRELQILKFLKNEQVLQMRDFYINHEGQQEYLNVVMDYYPYNLYQIIKKKQMTPILFKVLFYQILKGLNYLTSLSIAHRDIKPQNILVDLNTSKAIICDFGSAKQLVPGEPNLSYICSRCYRAPQLIFGAGDYNSQIDMWSVGCVLVEMINGNPPFLGQSQIDQLIQIIKVLGTPSKQNLIQMNKNYDLKQHSKFPHVKACDWRNLLHTKDSLLIDLVSRILQYSPKRRLTAADAIMHPYFDELRSEQNFKQLSLRHKSYYSLFNFSKQQLKLFRDPSEVVPDWLEGKKILNFNQLKHGIKKSLHRVT